MLHHAALEVDHAGIEAESRFWVTVGFQPVSAPESLSGKFTWFERGGTQIHLMHAEDPVIPRRGHVAVVVENFPGTLERLEGDGYEVTEGRRHWGERRAKVFTPAGHQVELMAGPPLPVVD